MIDWKKRLKREIPCLLNIFKRFRVRKILDCACGTGEHLLALVSWGFEVVGTDSSEEMLERAREKARERNLSLEFKKTSFEVLSSIFREEFDAVLCLGNSLPHVLEDRELEASLFGMYEALRENGILLIQVRNYDWIFRERLRFMKPSSRIYKNKEYLFFRMLDFYEDVMNFNIITFIKENDEWNFKVRSSPLRPLMKEELRKFLKKAGFSKIEFYSNYKLERWKRESVDTVVLALR